MDLDIASGMRARHGTARSSDRWKLAPAAPRGGKNTGRRTRYSVTQFRPDFHTVMFTPLYFFLKAVNALLASQTTFARQHHLIVAGASYLSNDGVEKLISGNHDSLDQDRSGDSDNQQCRREPKEVHPIPRRKP